MNGILDKTFLFVFVILYGMFAYEIFRDRFDEPHVCQRFYLLEKP